ncbi:Ema19p [Rhodotorula paludigena]|uniref:Ema19p n=1 Tax=Rhodotorula paludigena TaxID=86838 RepID=UPI003170F3FB
MLSQRARDWVYLTFLAVHIPATLLVDVQALFCAEYFSPAWLREIFIFAAKEDPLLTNATAPLFAWFQSFIILEVLFQLPVFFLGVRGLWKRQSTIYPLLALYGASSSTTTFACIATVLTTPGLTQPQLTKLLVSYVPFMLVPLAMAVDYGARMTRAMRTLEKGKAKSA